MTDVQTLRDLLAAQTAHFSPALFAVNLVLSAVLGQALGLAYARWGGGFSNRAHFARNFVVIAMTTMLLITIVRSSLALSVGLAGALSIIRFRAAIKEPEELAYVFISIAVGVGLGAERTLITLGGFALIVVVLAVRHQASGGGASTEAGYHLTVTLPSAANVGLTRIVELVRATSPDATLARFDETAESTQAAFRVRLADAARLDDCARKLRALSPDARIQCLQLSDSAT
jgi:hypothetical protein